MRYFGIPSFVWLLYGSSFKKRLVDVLGYSALEAEKISKESKAKYKDIIAKLPKFEKEDEFVTNIVSCAMLSSFLLRLKRKQGLEEITLYYSKAMMNKPTRMFCRLVGKGMFKKKDIAQRKKTAALKAAERNPYSWRMEFLPYSDRSGYECRFDRCGICTLMKELGLFEYTPAMCHLDYDMNQEAGVTFIRKHTLASGGSYCDCGYKKKEN